MYFPIGWPQTLSCDGNVRSIIANSDQSLFLFVSDDALSIWFCRPPVKIVNYQRTTESIIKYGHNISACWRSDSSQIVMQTSLDYLLFYQVIINDQDVMPIIEPKNIMSNSSILQENRIPRLFLQLRNSLKIDEGITCIMSAEEEMVISTKTGLLCGIDWDGHPDQDFRFNISVPPNHYLKKESGHVYHIIHFKYSTIIGGFSLVFSNGLGAFLPLNESTSTHTQLQLISHVDNALCTAINHKYAFILYGLISSDAVACDFDEVDRRFVISNRLSLPSNVYPDAEKILGPMTSLQWTPDSSVLATIWENGDFALWSVFGSLLSYSLSWHSSLDLRSEFNGSSFKVASLAFGKEGFHLWMVVHGLPADSKNDNEAGKPVVVANNNHVCKLSLVKSVLAANPCSSVSLESVLMSSEDRIFVGGNKNSSLIAQNRVDENERKAQTELLKNEKLSNVILSEQESNAVDSFQWITVTIPQNYLDINWPIRLFAIDSYTSQNIAVAGLNGFAMYSLVHRRWKMFGNENHEKDVTVTGGFLWYYEYLIAGCYNLSDENFEIRAYSHRNKLDNSNAKIITIENEVQLLSLYQNRLLAFCSNGNIFLYDLHLFKRNHHYSSPMDYDYDLNISAPIRVVLNNFELFPDCVTSCLLTDLHVEMYYGSYFHQSASTSASLSSSTEIQSHHHHHRSSIIQNSCASRSHSILFNYCGRVLLLEMDIDTSRLPFSSDEDDDDEDIDSDTLRDDNNKKDVSKIIPNNNVNGDHSGGGSGGPTLIKFKKVVKLASNVENLWVLPHDPVQLNAFRSPIIPSASVAALHRTTAYQQRPHLETSLYLSCGGHGMAIWLSLEHSIRPQYGNQAGKNSGVNIPPTATTTTDENNTNEHTFISKRIMLPLSEIGSAIYPLAIRFRDAIVLGAESDFTQPNLSYSSSTTKQNSQNVFSMMPYFLVKRTSQVYLHYILRELLRRNLGYRSWEIANTCSTLPHFVHSLELLLHGVLEEEASSSQPIPDALLPRVVDFIRAFPVFLQTVIHCARKTELALWPHLFSIVGSPKDLFQQCLQEGQLDTASSYIIVLQNLEKPEVASRCASRLLQAARVAGCWTTVKELKRFLRATNQAEENESMTMNNCDQAKSSRSNSLCDKQVPLAQQDVDVRSDQTSSVIPASHSPDIVPSMNGILETNHVKKPKARFGPGAAMKSSDDQINQKSDIHDHSLAENEADPQYQNNILKDSEESLNNFDDATSRNYQDSRMPKSSSYLYCNGNAKNARAYPGTILCMTSQDNNNEDKTQILNQALKFLALNEDSSVSSIVSTSSSSTFSSSSIAPASTVQNNIQRGPVRGLPQNNNNNNNFQTIKSGDGNSNAIEKLPPLRTISVASHDREQCRIS